MSYSIIQKNIYRSPDLTQLIIIAYLLIRIIFIRVVEIYSYPLPVWVASVLELSMYVLTALLFIKEKARLVDMHIDRKSLVSFILGGTILRIPSSELAYVRIIEIGFWAVTIFLAVSLRKSFKTVNRINYKDCIWVLWSFLIAIGLSTLFVSNDLSTILTKAASFRNKELFLLTIGSGIQFVYQFGHSSVLEEPVFRGFLWGYLQQNGVEQKWIWIIQAFLFWLAHLNYIDRPFSLLVTVPISGLVLGLVAWKSNSIAPCLILHATLNATFKIYDFILYSV